MGMTWGQIRLQAQKWGEDVDLDLLDQFLQGRYQMILDAHPWKALDKPGTLTTTAGTAGTRALYVLPADLKILLEVNSSAGNFPLRPYTQAELNMLYPGRQDVGSPFIYSMAEDSTVNSSERYAAGTVAVTHGVNTVTGTSTSWVTGQTGMQIRFAGDQATYIFTYVSSTTGTLDRIYEGTTGATDGYVLTVPPPQHQVELYPIPNATLTLPTRYTQIPATFDPTVTTNSPLPWVPPQVLINGVRADISALKKDYNGMQAFESLFASGINEMLRTELHRQPNSRQNELDRYQGVAKFPMPPGRGAQ